MKNLWYFVYLSGLYYWIIHNREKDIYIYQKKLIPLSTWIANLIPVFINFDNIVLTSAFQLGPPPPCQQTSAFQIPLPPQRCWRTLWTAPYWEIPKLSQHYCKWKRKITATLGVDNGSCILKFYLLMEEQKISKEIVILKFLTIPTNFSLRVKILG